MGLLRRWRRKALLYVSVTMLFMTCWSFMTLLIIAAQDNYAREEGESEEAEIAAGRGWKKGDDTYMGRGIQVVVGHFNGKIPDKDKANFTHDEINANNYSPVEGAGERGKGVRLTPEEENESSHTFRINQFNLVASDMIPLNRSLPDIRRRSCQAKEYPGPLPDTSVIIVFHNEAFSTLLRTVTSVITRSPPELLREIILVDDASEREFLGEPLETYVSGLRVRVKVVRAGKRVGLIRARLMGAAEANGDVLTFLDSHCECTEGWLQPLLHRIKTNRKVAVCPVIDVINDRTFAYQRGIELFRGGFNWNLQFRWYGVPPAVLAERGADTTLPIRSPTMAGGLFAIDRRWFYEAGAYDDQMDIWGGENLEMSFRLWMCSGSIEILPCSHVGHIFRKASPHDFPDNGSSKILNTNLVRVAEVFMDEWKHVFYKTAPHAKNLASETDVSDRVELRKRLRCKSFAWYLENVWPDHFLPKHGAFFGRGDEGGASERMELEVGSGSGDGCLQLTYVLSAGSSGRERRITTEPCVANWTRLQLWTFDNGSLHGDEHQCLSATEVGKQWIVQLKECGDYPKEKWDYLQYKQSLVHRESGLCLDLPLNMGTGARDDVKPPTLLKCIRDKPSQMWVFKPVDWLPKKSDSEF